MSLICVSSVCPCVTLLCHLLILLIKDCDEESLLAAYRATGKREKSFRPLVTLLLF